MYPSNHTTTPTQIFHSAPGAVCPAYPTPLIIATATAAAAVCTGECGDAVCVCRAPIPVA